MKRRENMANKTISQDFRLKNMDKIMNYFLEEINQNGLMIKMHKNILRF